MPCWEGATAKVNTVAGFPGSGNQQQLGALTGEWTSNEGPIHTENGHSSAENASAAMCQTHAHFWKYVFSE